MNRIFIILTISSLVQVTRSDLQHAASHPGFRTWWTGSSSMRRGLVISVKFVDSDQAKWETEIAFVKKAVRDSWSRVADIYFDFDDIYETTNVLQVKIGNEAAYYSYTKVMVLDFSNPQKYCHSNSNRTIWCNTRSRSFREHCIKSTAIHEFGHALAFPHEQKRLDTPANCRSSLSNDMQSAPDPGLIIHTEYDPDSVMNYCQPTRYEGKLSDLDIKAVQKLYGNPGGIGLAGLNAKNFYNQAIQICS